MQYDEMLKLEKARLEDNARGISSDDLVWLRKKMIEIHPKWNQLMDKTQYEVYVLRQMNGYCRAIIHDHPTDIRAYVENRLKEKEYDKKLNRLAEEVYSLPIGDGKTCDEMQKRILTHLEKAEAEFPGFKMKRELVISEIFGDIVAVRTSGFAGSARAMSAIRRRLKEKQEKADSGKEIKSDSK
jgi:hypothetical protein